MTLARGDRGDDGGAARPGRGVPAPPHRRARRDLVGRAHRPRSRSRPIARSADLAGRPDVARRARRRTPTARCYVVFGNHAHRLAPDLTRARVARRCRARCPYNSFVVLPDGHLVTKDFGGVLPGRRSAPPTPSPRELLVLEPEPLEIVGAVRAARAVDRAPVGRRRRRLRRRRHRRCSACAGTARTLTLDDGVRRPLPHDRRPDLRLGRGDRARRRVVPRQRRRAASATPARSAARASRRRRCTSCASTSRPARSTLTEICGLPERPRRQPARRRRAAPASSVGYDSGNGVLAAFDVADDGTLDAALAARPEPRVPPAAVPRHRRARHRRPRRDARWPTRSSCSTSRPATSTRARRHRQRGAVGAVPGRGFGRDLYYCSFAALHAGRRLRLLARAERAQQPREPAMGAVRPRLHGPHRELQ